MIRKIIQIDEDKCNGCGACANACHENAIGMVDGKAKLLRDDYCDGLGDCLPQCPTGAITFVEREAAAYDEAAVKENQLRLANQKHHSGGGCPGARARMINQEENGGSCPSSRVGTVNQEENGGGCPGARARMLQQEETASATSLELKSQLRNWPVQIKLAPINAPYFEGANLLIAADCAAYAYANLHQEFIRGRVTLIGCPKLDDVDYSEKLEAIISQNEIKSVTILRMEVPCCGGLEMAAKKAIQASGKFFPWRVVTISIDGKILD